MDKEEIPVSGQKKILLWGGILVLLVDFCTANNTVAIVIAGPVAKDIGDEFGVAPKRVASILDIFQ